MRLPATSLVLASALCAGMARAQTSDPEPLPDSPRLVYPEAAQKARVAGSVSFRVEVDANGAVTGVEVQAVPAPGLGFEEMAKATLRKWRYRPAMKEGRPVPGVHTGTFIFRLYPEDDGKIRKLVARFAEAFNGGRKEAMGPLLDPEITLRAGSSGRLAGPAVIEWLGSQGSAGWRLGASVQAITFMEPDLVHVDLALADPGADPAAGDPRSLATVAARTDGEWRFVTLRKSSGDRAPRAGGVIKQPRKVKHVAPEYPSGARGARIQGTVILECDIGTDGKVEDIVPLRGHPLLRAAAVDAVRSWQYTPTFVDGVAVPVIMTVTVAFRLR